MEERERTGPGIVGANFPFDHFGGFAPIDQTGFTAQPGSIGSARSILRPTRSIPVGELIQGFRQCFRGELCQSIMQRTTGLVRRNR